MFKHVVRQLIIFIGQCCNNKQHKYTSNVSWIDVSSLTVGEWGQVTSFFSTLVPGSGNFQLPDLAGLGFGLGFSVVFTKVFSLALTLTERGSSAVECRTRNQGSPGSNPLCYRFEDWVFLFSPLTPQLTQLYKWVPGYREWWKCQWFSRCA